MFECQSENQFFLFDFKPTASEKFHFFTPHFWQQQGRVTGSAQGRGTTYFLQTADLFGVNTALRHYYRGGLWSKINRDLYWLQNLANTRSFAEFYLLRDLREAGLPVPKPIGARVQKCGLFYRADLLSERIEHAQDLTALLQQHNLTPYQWQQIGGLIRQLHDLQICHTDLNAHNILCQQQQGEPKFWLIDFDKCGKKAGEAWKTENLQRLYRSFIKEVGRMHIQFSAQNWVDLSNGYNGINHEIR